MSGETLKAVLELETALARELAAEERAAEERLAAAAQETERLLAAEDETLALQAQNALAETRRQAERDAAALVRRASEAVGRFDALSAEDLISRLLPALQAVWPGGGR